MSDYEFDLVVIGSGPAGQKAAIQAAKVGKKVALIERDRCLGGACVHTGTIPSKTLRENAQRIAQLRRNAEVFEIPMREDMEMASLVNHMNEVLTAHDEYIQKQIARNQIELIHGQARFVDEHTVEVTRVSGKTRTLNAAISVIATGSYPRHLDNVPVDHEHILDSDSILSMIYLPKTMTVLGGGVIASEYASIFAALGVKVTMIDRYERPLGFLDKELTDKFIHQFEEMGGRFIGGANIKQVYWDGLSQVVTELETGEKINGEKLLSAAGRVANVKGLQIENAGLCLNDRGIIDVDPNCGTATPSVYAAGDVIGPPSLASASMEQGRRASCHAFGIDASDMPELIPMGIYSVPEISAVGMGEQQAIDAYGSAIVGYARFEEVARGHISGIQDGLLKMVADPTGTHLLGVHIVGEGATELIHIGQMGLLTDFTIDQFIENIFNFPTLAEAYRVAALQIRGERNQEMDA